MTSPQPQPHPAPSFLPASQPPEHAPQPQRPPQQTDAALTYTVIAPGPMRPVDPQRPLPPPPAITRTPAVAPAVQRVLISGAALIAIVLGVTLPGPLGSGWDAFLAWSIFAAAGALAVLAGGAIEHRYWSWRLQVGGAGALLLTWVIAGWPIAVSNVGFLFTIGVVLAVIAALRNPMRPPWRVLARGSRPVRDQDYRMPRMSPTGNQPTDPSYR